MAQTLSNHDRHSDESLMPITDKMRWPCSWDTEFIIVKLVVAMIVLGFIIWVVMMISQA